MTVRPLALGLTVRQRPDMRWLSILCVCATVTASAWAANVQFVRVWPQWHGADDFNRIGEYFDRDVTHGRELVVRTNDANRAGMYFLVRVSSDTAIENARLVLDIIRPDAPDPKQFTFPVSLGAKGRVVQVGLTGPDWPGGRDAHPVAWRFTLLDSAGQTLATEKSFLWENPKK